jgi:V/A-type H+-transporting ATPase subunit D
MTSEQINPTRMELINIKSRISLALKGYLLLKQKRDVLIIELMTLVHTSASMRDRLNDQMKQAYGSLEEARAMHSSLELETVALTTRRSQSLTVGVRNIMGVKIPAVYRSQKSRRLADRGYSITHTSARIDETARNFERALDTVTELAEKEVSMKRLLTEIEKTKRRVNALDYIVIPWLNDTQKDISQKLEELERDNFTMLKSVKKYLENSPENVSRS